MFGIVCFVWSKNENVMHYCIIIFVIILKIQFVSVAWMILQRELKLYCLLCTSISGLRLKNELKR